MAILWALVFFVALAFSLLRSREPSYQGKSLSEWMSRLYLDVDSREEARTALRAMGEPAVTHLTAMLERRDSRLKQKIIMYVQRRPSIYFKFGGWNYLIPAEIYRHRAITVLGEIGPTAKTAIPALNAMPSEPYTDELIKAALMKIRQEPIQSLLEALENPDSISWDETVWTAQFLGTNGQRAVPLLVAALQNTNPAVRSQAAVALGGIASNPEITVPALIEAAKDADPDVRSSALSALHPFKREKKQIVPVALASMQDTNFYVWMEGTRLLMNILDKKEQKAQLVPEYVESLKSSDPIIRTRAAFHLKEIDPAAAKKAGLK